MNKPHHQPPPNNRLHFLLHYIMHHHLYHLRSLLVMVMLSSLFISGCSTISIQEKSTSRVLSEKRASILTDKRLSVASRNILAATKQDDRNCLNNLSKCISTLKEAPELTTAQLHATLSELYLAASKKLELEDACQHRSEDLTEQKNISKKKTEPYHYHVSQQDIEQCIHLYEEALAESIRFSYAYLFFGNTSAKDRVFSDRQVQVRDFYNLASANLIDSIFERTKDNPPETPLYKVGANQFYIKTEPASSLEAQSRELIDLVSTYNLEFSGLNTQSKRDGFGVNYVAVYDKNELPTLKELLFDDENDVILGKTINQRIHQAGFLPITMVIEPKGDNLDQLLSTHKFRIRLMDPYKLNTVDIHDNTYNLAANFSAPYGVWLANNNYGRAQYFSLLAGFEELGDPELFMLEPYDPNKRVIVMIHGLASSPETWVNLTNDLLGDEVLRRNYQVWQVFYSTNLPVIENRYAIYSLLKTAFAKVDRKKQHKASEHAVLVGHSMGSVISRMLLSDTDMRASVLAPLDSKRKQALSKERDFPKRFDLKPLPQFDRAILMAGPFRGTAVADKWYTKSLRKMIQLPSAFVGEINNSLRRLSNGADDTQLAGLQSLFLDSGADQMSDKSAFMNLTRDVTIQPKVTYHTLMGRVESADTPKEKTTDGVVPYTSSHLDGAASEMIIQSGHGVHTTPEAVLELRRILRLQLNEVDNVPLPTSTVNKRTLDLAEKITDAMSESKPEPKKLP